MWQNLWVDSSHSNTGLCSFDTAEMSQKQTENTTFSCQCTRPHLIKWENTSWCCCGDTEMTWKRAQKHDMSNHSNPEGKNPSREHEEKSCLYGGAEKNFHLGEHEEKNIVCLCSFDTAEMSQKQTETTTFSCQRTRPHLIKWENTSWCCCDDTEMT